MPYQDKAEKIVIVGANTVGAETARWTAQLRLAPHIVLLDSNQDRADRAAVDIERTLAAEGLPSRVVASSSWHDAAGADIVVVTAGRGGSSWDDLLAADRREIRHIAFEIKVHLKEAVVIVAADPGESLVPLVQKVTAFPARSVLGIHGALYSAWLRTQVARETGVSPTKVAAHVLGGQGDAMVPLASTAKIEGKPLSEFLKPARIAAIVDRTRTTGAEPAHVPEGTGIHPAEAAVRIVRAVAWNERAILPCTATFDGEYRTALGACIALPAEVGRMGHWGVIALELSGPEAVELERASERVVARMRTQADG